MVMELGERSRVRRLQSTAMGARPLRRAVGRRERSDARTPTLRPHRDAGPPPPAAPPPPPRSEPDAARRHGGGELVEDVPREGVVEPPRGGGPAQPAVQPHGEGQRPLRV